MLTPDIEVLKDLNRFVEAHPPAGGFVACGAQQVVYLQPSQRIRISVERARGALGYALWRTDELAEAGHSDAHLDAAAFAKGLVTALADHLSIVDLEQVVGAFQTELDAMNAQRADALSRLKDAGHL
jgi:hypothetical protein